MKLLAWIFRVLLFMVALGFALSNTELTELRFFGVEFVWRAPLVVFLLGFFIAGVALGIVGVIPALFRQRREIGRLRRQLQGATRVPGAAPADPVQAQEPARH